MSLAKDGEEALRRAPTRPRAVTVVRSFDLSSRRRRVIFGGNDLADFALAGPAGHVKFYLPQPGQREIDFAALALPRGQRPPSAPISRTFTPRRFDALAGELSIDFFLHGNGLAADFARNPEVGRILAINGPARPHRILGGYRQLLVGDETSWPAIASILEQLPSDVMAKVIVETLPDDVLEVIESRAEVSITQVYRRGDASPGSAMVDALEVSVISGEPTQLFVGGEAVAIRRARAFALQQGFSLSETTTRGYWRAGVSNHPDHDMGDDE